MKFSAYISSFTFLFLFAGNICSQDNINLTIVHTNDTHSCVEPLSANVPDTATADKAGFLRRIAAIDELRKNDPELLLLDCGDFSQGSPYYNLFKGEVEIRLMNYMKYDAGTIGNHEFDYNLDNMARIFKMSNHPIICSNYDFSNTCLKDIVKPYIIINRKGLKIGIFAICPRLQGLVSAKNAGNTVYKDPVEVANQMGDMLKNTEKCDLVICLSHLGWNVSGADYDDEKMINSTKNIDIVLGGHSHSFFEEPKTIRNQTGENVICNQMGKNGQFIGILNVEMKSK